MAARLDLEIVKGSTFVRTFTKYSEIYINYRGKWTELTEYKVDDVIEYKNLTYKCILDTTNKQPPTNTLYFGSLTPFDYSTSTLEAKIRTDYNEEDSVIDFTTSFITDGTDGQIQLSLTATQTEALDFDTAVYDIEVTSGSTVYKEVYGVVTLQDEATY